jgi:hypothetical protein
VEQVGGVSSLPDAERDAGDVIQALAALTAMLSRPLSDLDGPTLARVRATLRDLAEDGGVAAVRVQSYLRTLRGAGDGEAVAVPPRLGQWREWVPPRGYLLGSGLAPERRVGEMHPRRSDPGE